MKKLSFCMLFFVLLFASCSNNVAPTMTGVIYGKAAYSNYDDSTGIVVSLERTDGITPFSVLKENQPLNKNYKEKILAGTTTIKSDGSFIFTNLPDGYYTVYAMSNISSERAVSINVQVINGLAANVGVLKLTATGSLQGVITVDSKQTGNEGISVFIGGTSFMAMTDTSGRFLISDIPAGNNYQLIALKGLYTKTIVKDLSITANNVKTIDTVNLKSSDINSGKSDTPVDYDSNLTSGIIYRNSYKKGAYKPVFNIIGMRSANYDFYSYGGIHNTVSMYNPVTDAGVITDVPYIEVTEFMGSPSSGMTRTVEVPGSKIKYTLNGSDMVFDAAAQTIYFDSYDRFLKYGKGIMDFMNTGSYLISGIRRGTRYGSSITIDMKSYGIPFYISNDKVYIPLQSYNDLFGKKFLFNGTAVYQYNIRDDFYNGERERSSVLADFNYKALCLKMDLCYGLKEKHNITSFDRYFTETGLKNDFYASSKGAMDALYKITYNYLADSHTWVNSNSPYAGKNYRLRLGSPEHAVYLNNAFSEYRNLRETVMTEFSSMHQLETGSVHDFSVIGDTAFITFDSFEYPVAGTNYYSIKSTRDLTINDVKDTLGLVAYSHQEIKKNNIITNVVVDLSVNGGGAVDSMVFINSWLQGAAELVIRNTITGAEESNIYYADVNLNHEIEVQDENGNWYFDSDSLVNIGRPIKVYCIISPCSFSCGNALPTLLKAYGGATLIGKTTGGGACIVGDGCTADGADFQISSNFRMGFMKNGSFYDTDKGVEPDFVISDFANVYNRTELKNFIESLK